MKLQEAYNIIKQSRHIFTPREISRFEFKISDLVSVDYPLYETLAHLWIRLYKSLPQKELIPSPNVFDSYNHNCAATWIITCKTIPPPELMPYNISNAIYSYSNDTLEMLWVRVCHTLPPPLLQHNSTIMNGFGYTCAMIWIKECRTIPPDELLHASYIKNKYGETCADIWANEIGGNIPPVLLV